MYLNLSFLGVTGLLLDILAVFVLANQRPRTSTSFILSALSLSDAFEILQLLFGKIVRFNIGTF